MKKFLKVSVVYLMVFVIMIGIAVSANHIVTVMSDEFPINGRKCIIIDAGHGGVDGGATSCTGIPESQINLEIALRLDDLMHLLGINTRMIRTDDRSVYTEGETIAAKKVSDLNERVRIINTADNAFLLSIHQNQFADGKYHGAQVFYADSQESVDWASSMQQMLISTLNPGSRRSIKKAENIYLLKQVTCPGILIECGFLSNPEEEAKLRSAEYQKKLCCVLASVCSQYLNNSVA